MPLFLSGQDWDIINTGLTTAYQEITYPMTIKNFIVQARGESNILHKRRTGDTKYFTIKAGANATKDILLGSASADSASLGFFKVEAGTDTLEAYVLIG